MIPPEHTDRKTLQLCQYLEWDSDFFGHHIARVTVSRLAPETIEQVLDWGRDHAIDCLYFLADAADPPTVRLAEDAHFRLVDIRVALDCRVDTIHERLDRSTRRDVRLCVPEDIPALRTIAKTNHRDTRFYSDPHFSLAQCDALYETWIQRSCEGYADAVWIAEDQAQPVSYLSCHLLDKSIGWIGLLGVAPAFHGRGIGGRLIATALDWFAAQGVAKVSVFTQGRNIRAQRLYQRFGFMPRSVQLWYHRWFNVAPGEDQHGHL